MGRSDKESDKVPSKTRSNVPKADAKGTTSGADNGVSSVSQVIVICKIVSVDNLTCCRILTERLPVLFPTGLLWSQVLVLGQSSLDQLLMLPEEDEESLLIWADDLLVTIMLATLD